MGVVFRPRFLDRAFFYHKERACTEREQAARFEELQRRRDRRADEFAPEKYAPRYGGYCAYAVARGGKAPTDPKAWTVVDGRLYLNYSLEVRRLWEKDIPGSIAAADRNWPEVQKLPEPKP